MQERAEAGVSFDKFGANALTEIDEAAYPHLFCIQQVPALCACRLGGLVADGGFDGGAGAEGVRRSEKLRSLFDVRSS